MNVLKNKKETLEDLLLRFFTPSATEAGTRMLTTSQLHSILDEHAPGMSDPGLLYEVLRRKGFHAHVEDDTIVWRVLAVKRS